MKGFLRPFFAITAALAVAYGVWARPDVWVNSYFRRDGTFVQGHMRSEPDGVFSNNWSTRGNVNPYTGTVGTKTQPTNSTIRIYSRNNSSPSDFSISPPEMKRRGFAPVPQPGLSKGPKVQTLDSHRSKLPSISSDEESRSNSKTPIDGPLHQEPRANNTFPGLDKMSRDSRIDVANRLKRLGHHVDWEKTSLLDMMDMESRISAANRLKRLGLHVDWEKTGLLDMMDMESRISAANRLKRLGHHVDWEKTGLLDMMDMESRISAANRLKRLGHYVDWEKTSLLDMMDMESRISAANRLKRLGHRVNWEEMTLAELMMLESNNRRTRQTGTLNLR